MKAPIPLESAIEKALVILALFSTMFLAYPETTVLAQGLQNSNGITAQVFDITSKQNTFVESNLVQTSLNIAEIVTINDLISPDLYDYLNKRGSPMAAYASEIPKYNNWKRALAISFVESNMCQRTPKRWNGSALVESYNCSGMANGKRVYTSYLDWFSDMNDLLNKPAYVNRPLNKFLGFYVVPGSPRWLFGATKVEGELTNLENSANAKYASLTSGYMNVATAGAPELAKK